MAKHLKTTRHTIWNNDTLEYLEAAREDYKAEYGEDMTEQEMYQMAGEDIDRWLDDEQANLNIQLDHPILVIGSLGLWNGRRSGYKVIESGNIRDIFTVTCGDFVEFYADLYNVRCTDIHHDGTNYYTFRELRKPKEECWPLLNAIYNGKEISSSLLNRYSRSILPHVANVYGWKYAGRRAN